jgi:protein SCO1/2
MSLRKDKGMLVLFGLAIVGLLGLLVVAAVYLSNAHTGRHDGAGEFPGATAYPVDDAPAPRMRLEDAASGKLLDTADLKGKPYMVTFLYTHCPTVCPLIGAELQQALSELGPDAKRVAVVALSVDPRGDTLSSVRSWLGVHHEPPSFHYLIGGEGRLRPYWNAWHVGPQIPGDPDSSHSAVIYLVTKQGTIAGILAAGSQLSSADLAHDFRAMLKG